MTNTQADTDRTRDYKKKSWENKFCLLETTGRKYLYCKKVTRGFTPFYSINRHTEDEV